MNLFQLVFKQMRQRSLSTLLTLVSIVLGVTLSITILILYHQSEKLFGQQKFGYDVLVGVKGSELQLTLNTVYHMDKSQGNIPYSVYEQELKKPEYRRIIKMAIPRAVGDSYQGLRIIGTTNAFFGYIPDGADRPEPSKRFEYFPGKSFEVASGRMMHQEKFEAVIGAEVSQLTGLKIGDQFQATHGMPAPNQTPDIHPEQWTVVGILAPTHTPNDRCLWIGLTSFYTIFEHAEAELDRAGIREAESGKPANTPAVKAREDHDADHDHATATQPAIADHDPEDHDADHDHATATQPAVADHDHEDHDADHEVEAGHDAGHHHHDEAHYTLDANGIIHLNPEVMEARELSAILIRSVGGGYAPSSLMYNLNLVPDVMAVNPASVMANFFRTFMTGSTILLMVISVLVIVVAIFGIMTTIYNSVAARRKEIAILRALGATRLRILLLICLESGLIGLIGSVLGLVLGHVAAGIGSIYFQQRVGQAIDPLSIHWMELAFVGGVIVVSALAGLVPALKVYSTPVASNLVAS